jgi:ubiquinone/menaquinone biosynthesis C-methylase UbiE
MGRMDIKQQFFTTFASQFQRPRGVLGRGAGWIMGHRSSNIERTRWAVALMDLRPGDHVLEIGFGPGVGIEALAEHVGETGLVRGIDHSELMVSLAERRNRDAVRAGRVRLVHGSVEQLPDLGAPLDAVLAVNNATMWPDPPARLRDLRARLRPGGQVMLVSQPRQPGADAAATDQSAAQLTQLLADAGFVDLTTAINRTFDPPAAAVRALASATVVTG